VQPEQYWLCSCGFSQLKRPVPSLRAGMLARVLSFLSACVPDSVCVIVLAYSCLTYMDCLPAYAAVCLHSAMVASWVSQASFEPLGLTIAVAKDRAIESMMQVRSCWLVCADQCACELAVNCNR
jgi:hypothetical protein